jgi:serine/threonine protein kinase
MTLPPPVAPLDGLFLRLQAALAGEYSIERELGRGGMGVVYLAREVRLAREVAIKALPPHLAAVPGLREQFVREAQMAARLSHPNIVPIHRVDEAQGFVYFVMAYVAGETLAQRIQTRGPLPPHQAARVLREVAWALTYAHANGIVHRDIKADNILLERNTDRALVTDFGIAGATHADARDSDGLIAGSAHYASPEQISGEPLSASSDLYSLGVTGFLALTGRLPFDARTSREVVAMQLGTRAPSIMSIAPTVPAKLAQIVERCLAKRPEQRFSSAAAFAEALEQAVEPQREIPPAIRVWLARSNEHRGLQTALGAYAGIGLFGPAVFLLHSPALGIALAVALAGSLITLPSIIRTRRVLKEGYDISDLRVALREYWVRRREEVVYEFAADDRVSRRVLATVCSMSGLATLGLGALQSAAAVFSPTIATAMITLGTLSVGSGMLLVARGFRKRANAQLGLKQMKFYDGKWGARWLRLASVGLRRNSASQSLSQLTEVALGRATDALYDALPKALRKQLHQLPATVRRLETDARTLRTELEKLDDSIATLDGDARGALPGAVAASSHEQRILSDRDALRTDLRATRDRAADRLAATVAGLENIRLDLLRLQLGDGHVASVTASLESAQEVAADLNAYADASAEVDRSLRPPPSSATVPRW